jgi:hypothetical protein
MDERGYNLVFFHFKFPQINLYGYMHILLMQIVFLTLPKFWDMTINSCITFFGM